MFLDKETCDLKLTIQVTYNGKMVTNINIELNKKIIKFTIVLIEYDYIDEMHYWTTETPNLYDVKFMLIKIVKNRLY